VALTYRLRKDKEASCFLIGLAGTLFLVTAAYAGDVLPIKGDSVLAQMPANSASPLHRVEDAGKHPDPPLPRRTGQRYRPTHTAGANLLHLLPIRPKSTPLPSDAPVLVARDVSVDSI
jgi:hypothetical protein